MFVEKYPEKKTYFELSYVPMKFAFPEPGPLASVISRSKADLRATSVYPMRTAYGGNVNLTGSQVGRRAVLGANGASESTVFKVLVGEQLPTSGSFWKAAGLRFASWPSEPSTTWRSTCRRCRRSISGGWRGIRRRTRLVPWFRRPRVDRGQKKKKTSVRGEVAVQAHRDQS